MLRIALLRLAKRRKQPERYAKFLRYPLDIEIVVCYDKPQEKELKYSARRHPCRRFGGLK
jgi:hypothetical protein